MTPAGWAPLGRKAAAFIANEGPGGPTEREDAARDAECAAVAPLDLWQWGLGAEPAVMAEPVFVGFIAMAGACDLPWLAWADFGISPVSATGTHGPWCGCVSCAPAAVRREASAAAEECRGALEAALFGGWIYDRQPPEACALEVAVAFSSGATATARAYYEYGRWKNLEGYPLLSEGVRCYAWREIPQPPPL